jgi:hypothetical protein
LTKWNQYQTSTTSTFYSNVHLRFRELVGQPDPKSDLGSAALSIAKASFFQSAPLKVVLAIDEASTLFQRHPDHNVTLFQMFCHSLRESPDLTGIFGILVDATSRVTNFLPNRQYDCSSRDIGTRGVPRKLQLRAAFRCTEPPAKLVLGTRGRTPLSSGDQHSS